MLVCNNCGSKDIEILAWVDANTNEYKSEYSDETIHKYCNNCQEHYSFKEIQNK